MSALTPFLPEHGAVHAAPLRHGVSMHDDIAGLHVRAEQFAQMQLVYGNTGGLVPCEVFLRLLGVSQSQPLSLVARRIVARSIVNLQWNGQTLIPMFQLDSGVLAMKPYMHETLYELVDVFDDWEIACWFTQPNPWLSGCAPAIAMLADPESVFLAARADRFVAKG